MPRGGKSQWRSTARVDETTTDDGDEYQKIKMDVFFNDGMKGKKELLFNSGMVGELDWIMGLF